MATPQPIELYIPNGERFEIDREELNTRDGDYWYVQRIGGEEVYVMFVNGTTMMACNPYKIPEQGLYNMYKKEGLL